MKKRIEWIDIIKFICIMFVMLSHLESDTTVLRCFYSPFFLTLFFFSSGYVYKNKDNFKTFFLKKVKTLFVPWLIFSVFNILLSSVLSFNEHDSLWVELGRNFLQVRGYGDGLWFVAALFVAFIPYFFIVKFYEKKKEKENSHWIFLGLMFMGLMISRCYSMFMPIDIFSWGSNALPWHIEYVFDAMFFMALGYVFRENFEIGFDKLNNRITCCVSGAVFLMFTYFTYFVDISVIPALSIEHTFFTQIFGCIFIISLSKHLKTNKYISYIGANTIICFALHGKVLSLGQTILHKLFDGIYTYILNNMFLSSVFAIIFTIGMSIVLIIPIYVINRWLPFVVGRKNQKVIKED